MKKITIIGAGIVGLATAYKLVQKYKNIKITILEKESGITKHQTGRNSGVIHSGIYYTPGSLKARNCRNGYKQLLAFCDENEVDYDICGKLIIAKNQQEIPALMDLYKRGISNQLTGLQVVEKNKIANYEPYAVGEKALFVPETGIINYTDVANKYLEKVLLAGGEVFYNQKVIDIIDKKPIEIITNKQTYTTDIVYNCAGLYSDKLAKKTGKISHKIIPFRGEYYQLKPDKSYLVKNLIYPVPNPEFPFLGVHFTRKLSGGIEAGPNAVLAFGRESYQKTQINFLELFETLTYSGFLKVAKKYWKDGAYEMYRSWSKKAFTKALQSLIPNVQESDLITANAGIRAQAIDYKGNLIDDFLINKSGNIIHVGNAPSPAATASLAIADELVKIID